ncbi:sensor histidine kinase [Synechococcus elongatus]|uniref:histidine kinase n=1 Tax=Synechococcus elongatus PCC 11802 TaxID=2283154 RepID=A0AAU6R5P0_SYNEL|nr:HAMP domain-containing sensor histidine kinase [Synechococcus elongatus]QFZ93358.1 HAMP domain-containing histidine kinase [Synechococcus elongatus PCC 11802]
MPSSPLIETTIPGLSQLIPAELQTITGAAAEPTWWAMLQALRSQLTEVETGLVLTAPLPFLSDLHRLDHWLWVPEGLQGSLGLPQSNPSEAVDLTLPRVLPLALGDPLLQEPFCLVLSDRLSFLVILVPHETTPLCCFSQTPEVLAEAVRLLAQHTARQFPALQAELVLALHRFRPLANAAETWAPFWATVLQQWPTVLASDRPPPEERSDHPDRATLGADLELLQAIAHEVKTPLATIRTLTRSLLRRADLPAQARKRLEAIDLECSEQIDRFGLFFRAVELENRDSHSLLLARTSLTDVFAETVPRWRKQAERRSLALDLQLPERMPAVVSDPTMLDQALTSLVERFTRNLPAGSRIEIVVSLAGAQLKLRLTATELVTDPSDQPRTAPRSLGQLLTVQPETGSLSLKLEVSKNLFQALGGKLTVRRRSPQASEVITVFLPVEPSDDATATDSPR